MAVAQPGPFAAQELQDLRGPVARELSVSALNPEYARGVATTILCRQDGTSTLVKIFGPLCLHLESLCQHLAPQGSAWALQEI
eukprot:11050285-Alexandrium_andersonii.AAC.1